uniref:Protein kinase domain-containing protein n=1 Tax=Syphacia muris TaxID=451379 RepID=A0A0N5AJT3_9BILA
MRMKFIWIAILLPWISVASYCNNTEHCVHAIRRLVTEQQRFWFGEQWKLICTDSSTYHRRSVDCYNPPELRHYFSVGNRLFRVKTYQAGYLQNLKIFPRIFFRPQSGTYRACDHKFIVNEAADTVIEVGYDRLPIEPYRARFGPEIRWPGYDDGRNYVVVFVDIGFGTLNYLAIGYPAYTQVLRKYVTSENFRSMVNPVAVLIFEQPEHLSISSIQLQTESELFNLPRFMLENGLENGLIGLNLILVSYDGYAIEKQRLQAVADNCHFLIEQRLHDELPWEFLRSFPLNEMDAWLSVEFHQPEQTTYVCCKKLKNRQTSVNLDPIANNHTPSLAVRNVPTISSLRISENDVSYQRNTRDFLTFATLENKYALVLFNPEKSILHWLITDIPSSSLAVGHIRNGHIITPYMQPIPTTPKSCSSYVFMLFQQPRSTGPSLITKFYNENHQLRSAQCQKNCSARRSFDVCEFKSFHQLRLSAINWMNICFDLYEAQRQIAKLSMNFSSNAQQLVKIQNRSGLPVNIALQKESTFNKRYVENAANNAHQYIDPEKEICAAMGIPRNDDFCEGRSMLQKYNPLLIITIILFCLSTTVIS